MAVGGYHFIAIQESVRIYQLQSINFQSVNYRLPLWITAFKRYNTRRYATVCEYWLYAVNCWDITISGPFSMERNTAYGTEGVDVPGSQRLNNE